MDKNMVDVVVIAKRHGNLSSGTVLSMHWSTAEALIKRGLVKLVGQDIETKVCVDCKAEACKCELNTEIEVESEVEVSNLLDLTAKELKALAKEAKIVGYAKMNKTKLVKLLSK